MKNIDEMTEEELIAFSEEQSQITNRVAQGEKVPCPVCGELLFIVAPWGNSEWVTEENLKTHLPGVYCSKDDKHFAVQLTFDDLFIDE
ncbi:MAG: hypothetical protein Q8942_05535 [Bacillota bacterium]|nr:hypothetical protein [Bacillota bacterium]